MEIVIRKNVPIIIEMANQVSARLKGDDFQHLYAWSLILELWMPYKNVVQVKVEDPGALSVDDVTIYYEDGKDLSVKFNQIKYHVDRRKDYSSTSIVTVDRGKTSLLEKFWKTWKLLNLKNPEGKFELVLISNWDWDSTDGVFKSFISNNDNSIRAEFLSDPSIRSIKELWQSTLKAGDQEFSRFVASLRLKYGWDCTEELKERVSDRMNYLGLKSDDSALLIASGIVRELIKKGSTSLTKEILDELVDKYDLRHPGDQNNGVAIYLSTVKEQKFEILPDYIVDWRNYFEGDTRKTGHQLKDGIGWNETLLPEIVQLEEKLNRETDCRLIKARGLARLSAWFAFASIFSDTARYTIEVDQNGILWRTDSIPNEDFDVQISNGSVEGENVNGEGDVVAVGISITGSLEDDVREYLAISDEKIAAVLMIRPNRELGRNCLRDAGDVTALANKSKDLIRQFVKKRKAKKLLLFYFGPLSGACFIGHKLNAICKTIQIMENQQPGYAPSFCLQ